MQPNDRQAPAAPADSAEPHDRTPGGAAPDRDAAAATADSGIDLAPPVEPPPVVIMLERLEPELPHASIEELWVFPPRRGGGLETGVVVFALLPADGDLRPVLTAQYSATRDKRGRLQVQHLLAEHGAASPDRLQRVIEGVIRRIDESLPSQPPRAERIEGDPDRWEALLASLRSGRPSARVARPGRMRYQ